MNSTKTVEELNSEEVERLVPLLIYLVLIAVTGLPGNTVVCLVYRQTSIRSVSRFFIWWLAVIDIISCFVLFLEIVNVVKQHTYTNMWLCKLTIFFTIWPVVTSGLGLCLISIDRFRRVCRPLQKQISQRMARFMCLATVIIAFLFAWPSLILYGTYETNIERFNLTSSTCTVQNKFQGTPYTLVYNGLLWLLFLFSLVFLCVMYILIGRKVCTQMDQSISCAVHIDHVGRSETTSCEDNTTDTSVTTNKSDHKLVRNTVSFGSRLKISSQRQAKARKSAFIMFLISFIFIISFLPYLILRINEAFDEHYVKSMSNSGRAGYKFFLRSYFLNCAVNPFIYCACAVSFRRDVQGYLRRLWRKRN